MRRTLITVDSHTMGEPTRVLVGGLPNIPGDTMAEKVVYAKQHLNHIRTALLLEPRGHRDMFGAILTQPTRKDADVGVIFIDSENFLNMCGHGTIGVVTTLVETGIVNVTTPVTEVMLDTGTGLVRCWAKIENGKVIEVTFQNAPAFHYLRKEVLMPSLGPVCVDICFGGNFFAIVKADEIGCDIIPKNSTRLLELGLAIRETVNEQVAVCHPEYPHIDSIELTEIYCCVNRNHYKNVVILGAGQVDRSPCGTGTCAQLANLYYWGKLKLNEEIFNDSIIDTRFFGKVIDTTKVGDFDAVIPHVRGRAFITGYHHFVIDEDDPVKYGFWVG